jgi:hypothetical protein
MPQVAVELTATCMQSTHILRTQLHQIATVQSFLKMGEQRPKHVEALTLDKQTKDTASSKVHLHYAHAARTASSTHRTGRPHQPDSQVQPTHALKIIDSKAKLCFSRYHYHIQLAHFKTLI